MSLAGRLRRFSRLHEFSRRVRLRYTNTGRLLVFVIIVSALIGIDINRSLGYQIFSLLFALLLVSWLYTLRRGPPLSVQRHLPALAAVGQELDYRLRIVNDSGGPVAGVTVADALREEYPSVQEFRHWRVSEHRRENWFDRHIGYPSWQRLLDMHRGARVSQEELPALESGESRELQLRLTPVRRGYLHFDLVRLGTPDPLGLCRQVQRKSLPGRILVLPRTWPLPPVRLPGGRHYHQGGVSLAASTADTLEFHGLRDYRPGDPLRNIHWRSWARFGEPVVKTWEEEYFVRHALILDTCGGVQGESRFEAMVSAAASLALACNDQELLLELMFVAGQAHRFTAGRHVDTLQAMLEVLACVQPEPDSSLQVLCRNVLSRRGELATALCIFPDWDAPRRELVQTLRGSGVIVLALVVEEGGDTGGTGIGPGADGEFRLHADCMQQDLLRLCAAIAEMAR